MNSCWVKGRVTNGDFPLLAQSKVFNYLFKESYLSYTPC